MTIRRHSQLLLPLLTLLAVCPATIAAVPEESRPVIVPDYTDVVFPPNMVAPTFVIRNKASQYRIVIRSRQGSPIEIKQQSPSVAIPPAQWRDLLAVNRGQPLEMTISLRQKGGNWVTLAPLLNQVSTDEIDRYLSYRLLKPLHNFYHTMGIYQRDLTSYCESPVMRNSLISNACLNCHTYLNHGTTTMSLNIRHQDFSNPLVLVQNGVATRVAMTTGYMSWHPSGRLLAYSNNRFSLFFHTKGEPREVFDATSNLGIYHVDNNSVESPAAVAVANQNETWPAWSPAGDYLYYCRAPQLPVEKYREVKYDLMRVSYNVQANTWGTPEVLVSAADTMLSMAQPKVSPDGRFVLYTTCDYGNFPIYQRSADLHIMDLETRKHWKGEANSDEADSWHCWSENGRWVVFSSKRRDGHFARPHFSHVDKDGHFSKPFILPQQDPEFYDSYLNTYNLPELTREPARIDEADLAAAVTSMTRTLYPKKVAGPASPNTSTESRNAHPMMQ